MEEVKEKLSVKTKYQIVVVLLVAIIISLLIAVTVVTIHAKNIEKEPEPEVEYVATDSYVTFDYAGNIHTLKIWGYYIIDDTYIELVFNTNEGKLVRNGDSLQYVAKNIYTNLPVVKTLTISRDNCILYMLED